MGGGAFQQPTHYGKCSARCVSMRRSGVSATLGWAPDKFVLLLLLLLLLLPSAVPRLSTFVFQKSVLGNVSEVLVLS